MSRFTLFEISWEVAHRVGGIHTVVSTKARTIQQRLGDDHVVIGPWLLDQHDPDAVLDPVTGFGDFEEDCRRIGLPVRVGRWRVPGRPLTILVEFSSLYEQKDAILAELWETEQVDSLRGDWGYVEPVLFAHAAGRIVERYWRDVVRGSRRVGVVQAHEWMCGAALLYLSKTVPELGTVFTAHATVIGRAAAAKGWFGADALQGHTPEDWAAELGVPARHSMEAVSARQADVFTAVSDIASAESERFFDRAADPVLPNGLDPDVLESRLGGTSREESRARLRDLASRFLGEDVGDAAILASGARYEFRNKGLDLVLDAAGAMNEREGRPVVIFLLVPAGNSGLKRIMSERLAADGPVEGPPIGISTHNLFDPASDPIVLRCKARGLDNAHGSRVKVIHWADYVGPEDGILNLRYEAVLQGADATCFPSFYESWGYTPQESLALGIPTVTTDHAGFGLWVRERGFGPENGVHVVERAGRPYDEIAAELFTVIEQLAAGPKDPEAEATACREVAAATYWDQLIPNYEAAFAQAVAIATLRAETTSRPALEHVQMLRTTRETDGRRPHVFRLDVVNEIPVELAGLRELADNWWWCWDPDAPDLFERLCPETWARVHHNPIRLLREVEGHQLELAATNTDYVERLGATLARFRAEVLRPLDEREVTAAHPVAYLCAEFGIHESMPIYSGGLGVLAGDHLRAASDLGIPFVAVGLLYRAGYMRQELRGGVEQAAVPERVDPADLPMTLVRNARGEPVEVELRLPGSVVRLRAWKTPVGRVSLYLLDADVASNREEDRELTRALYSGDQEMRIRQELVLGLGGVRLLHAIGVEPSVVHVNEGHGAFAALERVHRLLREDGLTFEEAREVVRATTVFTTHTPVPAGHDEFPEDLVRRYFGDTERWAGLPWDRFFALGGASDRPGRFNMTALAMRFAAKVNGVSKKHGEVSRTLLAPFAPQLLPDEMPVESVTNGVHLGAWTHPAVTAALGATSGSLLAAHFAAAREMSDGDVWALRQSLRGNLRERLAAHVRASGRRQGASPTAVDRSLSRLGPDALVIGFARRFATYKRAALLFRDMDRLARILEDAPGDVVFLMAGKAHPRDTAGQELIASLARLSREERFRGRLLVLENYDMGLARWLVSGVDVWLNTPRPPLEASGTSGMKAAANGVLNLSVGDGWWLEGFDGTPGNENGWTIGAGALAGDEDLQDAQDAASLLDLLEHEVIPAFFERDGDGDGVPPRWAHRVRNCLVSVPPAFAAARMVGDYRDWAYEPLAARHTALSTNRHAAAQVAFAGVLDAREKLPRVRVVGASAGFVDEVRRGEPLELGVEIDLDGLTAGQVTVEALLGRPTDDGGLTDLTVCELAHTGTGDEGVQVFTGRVVPDTSGAHGYAIRVRPSRPGDHSAFDDPVVWA